MPEERPTAELLTDEALRAEIERLSLEVDEEGKPLSKNALKKRKKDLEKLQKKQQQLQQAQAAQAAIDQDDYAKDNYGVLPLNQSQSRPRIQRTRIADLNLKLEGQRVTMRARLQTTRSTGGKQCFMVLRELYDTVQAVLAVDKEQQAVSKQMVKFVNGFVSYRAKD